MKPGPLRLLSPKPLRMAAASALVLLGVSFAGPARADTGPALGGWNVSANGNVIDILVDNTVGLAGIHPFTEADFPDAESQFATGPFGSGMASVFWPGNAVGDFGSLSGELGMPSQLQPLVSKMNDPVKASAQYPSGPASSSYPAGAPAGAFDMHATAGASGITSTADISGGGTKGVLSFGVARGSSSAVADSSARAAAQADLTHLSLLGGLIDIASISSTASAKSDGQSGTGSATTHITGVTVLGQPASVGSDGLVLPNFAKVLNPVTGPVVQNLVSQVISGLGIKITELPSTQKQDGTGYSTTSGGLSIEMSFPSSAVALLEKLGSAAAPLFPSQAAIVPTLPGLLQGMTLTITVGRATASASASPPFNDSFNPPAAGSDGASGGTGPAGVPATGDSSGASTAASGGSGAGLAGQGASPSMADPSAGTAPAAVPSGAATTGAPTLPATMISLSSPLGVGIVVLGLIAAGATGYALWRLARLLLAPDAGPVCPLGQENP